MLRPALLIACLLPIAACEQEPSPQPAPPVGLEAPSWTLSGPGGTFSLADAAGRPVVLQFGPSAPEAWTALEAAHEDLEAAGALVVGAVVEGAPTALRLPFATVSDSGAVVAERYGYTGTPLVVVIDAEGRLRSRAEAVASTDQFFDLAANALLEADDVELPTESASEARAPRAVNAAEVRALVLEGAALFDLRPETERDTDGPIEYALIAPVESFSPDVLPMNALVPVILAGPAADSLAAEVTVWGYREVYMLPDASALASPEAAPLDAPTPEPPSRLPARRRAIG